MSKTINLRELVQPVLGEGYILGSDVILHKSLVPSEKGHVAIAGREFAIDYIEILDNVNFDNVNTFPATAINIKVLDPQNINKLNESASVDFHNRVEFLAATSYLLEDCVNYLLEIGAITKDPNQAIGQRIKVPFGSSKVLDVYLTDKFIPLGLNLILYYAMQDFLRGLLHIYKKPIKVENNIWEVTAKSKSSTYRIILVMFNDTDDFDITEPVSEVHIAEGYGENMVILHTPKLFDYSQSIKRTQNTGCKNFCQLFNVIDYTIGKLQEAEDRLEGLSMMLHNFDLKNFKP